MKIGFIGLGQMGSAMAATLLKAGHDVTVYNRTAEKMQPLVDQGAESATRVSDACNAAAVFTMLSDDHAVEDVVLSDDGVVQHLPEGAIHISSSTIGVELSRRLEEAHREKGQGFVSAPVFGRPDAATEAKLFIVAAGPAEQISRCRPLFDAIGQKTFVVGDEAPAANVVKLAGNFLITTVIESLAEAIALVRKSGLDPNTFVEFLTESLFAAPACRTYGTIIAAERFEPAGFPLPLGFKDNHLLIQAAEQAAVPMPMASLIHDRFLAAMAQGMGEADWSSIARLSYQSAGLEEATEPNREYSMT
ncbi:MAG: NAD(P)-dependent oxidoreductase [Solirubrobacterales bacterium]